MKEIVPADTRYIPFTQQRWCCVAACISMIMYRRGIPLIPQELLAVSLGLVVPKEEGIYFWNPVTGERPSSGWGTRMKQPGFEPNRALKGLKIPLRLEMKLIDQFKTHAEVRNFLVSCEREGSDVLICFDWGVLNDEKKHNGHVCVFDRLFFGGRKVRLIDPEYRSPKWKMIETKKLFEAMNYHGRTNLAGFWIVKEA